ncbi:MAG: ethylbenzene dehydrogenase-related protein [Candidatus Binatia bacterium]
MEWRIPSLRHRAAFLILLLALSLAGVPKVYSQGVVLVSRFVEGELPADDPDASLWEKAVPLKLPLSSQVNFKPRIYDATVSSLTIRSLNDGQQIAFLLEWDDPTRDVGARQVKAFADAVAIQHPVDPTKEKVWFCMGMPGAAVNIWYWNAAWQEDLKEATQSLASSQGGGWDYYPSQASGRKRKTPVEDLNAARMQTLTAQPVASQNVEGKGVWHDGKWKVVLTRAFTSQDEGDTQFKSTEETQKLRPIAFAVWDGRNGEVDGRKAVSAFYFLDISTTTGSKGYGFVLPAVVLTIGVEVGLVWWFRRRRKKEGLSLAG